MHVMVALNYAEVQETYVLTRSCHESGPGSSPRNGDVTCCSS